MKKHFLNVFVGFTIILLSLEHCCTYRHERLLMRKLSSSEIEDNRNFDDIREIVSASLTANEPHSNDAKLLDPISNENVNAKRSSVDDEGGNVLREESMEVERGERQSEEAQTSQRQISPSEVRSEEKSPIERSEVSSNYEQNENSDELRKTKDVAKREAHNEDEYDDDDPETNPESSAESSANDNKRENVLNLKESRSARDSPKDERRDSSAVLDDSNLDYQKEIEEQIQHRIDSIKEDIKREIEKKQQVREIEANNAKFDELEFPSIDEENSDDDNSAYSAVNSAMRSKRDSVAEENKNIVLPIKRREVLKRAIIVNRRNVLPMRRKDRSAILIPEQGHAEVKDYLPADLTLDPKLRIARSYEPKDPSNSRLTRSIRARGEENPAARRRRRGESYETNGILQNANFLFPSQEREPRGRRRRSRNRSKSLRDKRRKISRHTRPHRAIRESWMDESDRLEERDKRAMPLDEDAALEYKESFGGFPSDTGGVLGRYKRIKRIAELPEANPFPD